MVVIPNKYISPEIVRMGKFTTADDGLLIDIGVYFVLQTPGS